MCALLFGHARWWPFQRKCMGNKLEKNNVSLSNGSVDLAGGIVLETHPWKPFVPDGAKVLILGTFPPQPHRWGMDFYYPNRTNDFWKICGYLFFNDRNALYDETGKNFNVDAIRALMTEKKIALGDTARQVRRLKNNASDKYLEIVAPLPLYDLLKTMPDCHAIVTTGEKAAGIIAGLTGTEVPQKGCMVKSADGLEIWRMPSTSRAYPLPLEEKAEYYAVMFRHLHIL